MMTDTVISVLSFILRDIPFLILSLLYVYLKSIFHFFFPLPLKSLSKEIILVTGSANGLGKELCLALSTSGATLVCWDLDKRQNDKFVKILRENGTNAYGYSLDISNYEKVKAYADKVREDVGNVSMVINNAGIFLMKSIEECSPEEVERIYRVNVFSHFWILKNFLPNMIEKGRGHVVAIASSAVYLSPGRSTAYSSTKHAIHGMMEALRDEITRNPTFPDIKMTTVYPHAMDTNMSKKFTMNARFSFTSKKHNPAECAKQIIRKIRRNAEYIDVPNLVVFLTKFSKFLPPKILSQALNIGGFTNETMYITED